MLTVLDPLRELTLDSIALRMLLAVVCGGLIGLERESKRRPAGFRTHILICLGACMTTLTGHYLTVYMNYYTDMSRLGAQVIAGIGFIGAGTIIVTKRRRVRGLTTAAGLWTAAIIGLCFGAGYYEGAVAATVLILLAELVFIKLEYWMSSHAREINIYVQYNGGHCIDDMAQVMREQKVTVFDMEFARSTAPEGERFSVIFLVRPEKSTNTQELLRALAEVDGVNKVEKL